MYFAATERTSPDAASLKSKGVKKAKICQAKGWNWCKMVHIVSLLTSVKDAIAKNAHAALSMVVVGSCLLCKSGAK